jgi:hypothetical protein
MEFYFHHKNDLNKEPINRKKLGSYNEALNYFSTLKKLTPNEFLNVFKIDRYE